MIGELEASSSTTRTTSRCGRERQSGALDALGQLKAILAEDLGIDPGPTLREPQARILPEEPLDVKSAAQSTASFCPAGTKLPDPA